MLSKDYLILRACERIGVTVAINKCSLVFPAKAGTHRAAAPERSSNGNALPTLECSCPGEMGPGLRRGDERGGGSRIPSHALRGAQRACPRLELGARLEARTASFQLICWCVNQFPDSLRPRQRLMLSCVPVSCFLFAKRSNLDGDVWIYDQQPSQEEADDCNDTVFEKG